ncbi:regulatory LuxR family protein [Algoriphagus boseongensis]|uniref:Regulatory LuxR family protein n=1 Tax=Algoriphagus boseongensis TaxID=1442587 RepID=A0A4R6T974_9BACT|nr:LuxR C-terminal-related transcriptional regulator [Algoriphagus boseongensis]TDQ19306.1 regulatory LuxR family protein [Algoriphagus boseongensis]
MFFAKFRKPLIDSHFVVKEDLIMKLSDIEKTKVLLVNAPAGYGKSSFVSYWLDRQNQPYSWISIEKKDDHFRVFLEYFVKSLDQNVPGLFKKVEEIFQSTNLPQLEVICQELLNHLEINSYRFNLILDDFHLIKNKDIHELISCFIKYKPDNIRLVLISRELPELNLSEFFLKGELVQITQKDLGFNIENINSLLKKNELTGWSNSEVEKLHILSEGWILGINLILKGKKSNSENQNLKYFLDSNLDFFNENFLTEQLKGIDARLLEFLLVCSIPEQFDFELANKIGKEILNLTETETNLFFSELKQFNLFFIGLDGESNLVKIHHLFKNYFYNKLRKQFEKEKVRKVYQVICEWYIDNNAVEDSIHYALEGELYEYAARLIIQNRFFEINENRLWKLDSWVKALPEGLRISRPELILSQLPTLIEEFKIQEVVYSINLCERLLEGQEGTELFAELAIYKSFLSTWIFTDPQKALKEFEIAKKIYLKNDVFLARYCFYRSVSLFFLGKKEEAIRELEEEILKCSWNMKGQLQKIRIYLELLDAKFLEAKSLAFEKNQTFGKSEGPYQKGWTNYTLGNILLQIGDVEKSIQFFSELLENKWQILQRLVVDTFSGLAISYSLKGDNQIAQKYLDDLKVYLSENDLNHFFHFHESTEARICLYNRENSVLNWSENFNAPIHLGEFHFLIESPFLTCQRVKICLGSQNQVLDGIKNLNVLKTELSKFNINYHELDILLLLAIGYSKIGEPNESENFIKLALEEVRISNQMRAFFELRKELVQVKDFFTKSEFGNEIFSKINSFKLNQTQETLAYSINHTHSISKKAGIIFSITEREMEIINAAAKGLRNKEIAELLNVSPETVKSHLKNIFKKLGTNNRTELLNFVHESSLNN